MFISSKIFLVSKGKIWSSFKKVFKMCLCFSGSKSDNHQTMVHTDHHASSRLDRHFPQFFPHRGQTESILLFHTGVIRLVHEIRPVEKFPSSSLNPDSWSSGITFPPPNRCLVGDDRGGVTMPRGWKSSSCISQGPHHAATSLWSWKGSAGRIWASPELITV